MTPLRCAAGLFAALAAGAYLAPAQPPPASAPPPNRIVGAMSCAAAACHGNDGPKGAGGSELHTVAETITLRQWGDRFYSLTGESTGVQYP